MASPLAQARAGAPALALREVLPRLLVEANQARRTLLLLGVSTEADARALACLAARSTRPVFRFSLHPGVAGYEERAQGVLDAADASESTPQIFYLSWGVDAGVQSLAYDRLTPLAARLLQHRNIVLLVSTPGTYHLEAMLHTIASLTLDAQGLWGRVERPGGSGTPSLSLVSPPSSPAALCPPPDPWATLWRRPRSFEHQGALAVPAGPHRRPPPLAAAMVRSLAASDHYERLLMGTRVSPSTFISPDPRLHRSLRVQLSVFVDAWRADRQRPFGASPSAQLIVACDSVQTGRAACVEVARALDEVLYDLCPLLRAALPDAVESAVEEIFTRLRERAQASRAPVLLWVDGMVDALTFDEETDSFYSLREARGALALLGALQTTPYAFTLMTSERALPHGNQAFLELFSHRLVMEASTREGQRGYLEP